MSTSRAQQIKALESLYRLYDNALYSHNWRGTEWMEADRAHRESQRLGKEASDYAEKIEKAKERLIATGIQNVPQEWLAVKAVSDVLSMTKGMLGSKTLIRVHIGGQNHSSLWRVCEDMYRALVRWKYAGVWNPPENAEQIKALEELHREYVWARGSWVHGGWSKDWVRADDVHREHERLSSKYTEAAERIEEAKRRLVASGLEDIPHQWLTVKAIGRVLPIHEILRLAKSRKGRLRRYLLKCAEALRRKKGKTRLLIEGGDYLGLKAVCRAMDLTLLRLEYAAVWKPRGVPDGAIIRSGKLDECLKAKLIKTLKDLRELYEEAQRSWAAPYETEWLAKHDAADEYDRLEVKRDKAWWRIEQAHARLVACGLNVPDRWLSVEPVGVFWEERRGGRARVTTAWPDHRDAEGVCKAMYVALLKLEETGQWAPVAAVEEPGLRVGQAAGIGAPAAEAAAARSARSGPHASKARTGHGDRATPSQLKRKGTAEGDGFNPSVPPPAEAAERERLEWIARAASLLKNLYPERLARMRESTENVRLEPDTLSPAGKEVRTRLAAQSLLLNKTVGDLQVLGTQVAAFLPYLAEDLRVVFHPNEYEARCDDLLADLQAIFVDAVRLLGHHAAWTAAESSKRPRQNAKEPPKLDYDRKRIKVSGKWHDLSDEQTCMLDVLFKAEGAWVGGSKLGRRPDKTRARMAKPVRDIVETHLTHGYRIPSLSPE